MRERQQPPYADNWHRSIKPQYSVLSRDMYTSRLHPDVRTAAKCDTTSRELAGRIFLPLSWLKIRSSWAHI